MLINHNLLILLILLLLFNCLVLRLTMLEQELEKKHDMCICKRFPDFFSFFFCAIIIYSSSFIYNYTYIYLVFF